MTPQVNSSLDPIIIDESSADRDERAALAARPPDIKINIFAIKLIVTRPLAARPKDAESPGSLGTAFFCLMNFNTDQNTGFDQHERIGTYALLFTHIVFILSGLYFSFLHIGIVQH